MRKKDFEIVSSTRKYMKSVCENFSIVEISYEYLMFSQLGKFIAKTQLPRISSFLEELKLLSFLYKSLRRDLLMALVIASDTFYCNDLILF